MIPNYNIVVGLLAGSQEIKVLYIGNNRDAGDKVYRAAGDEYLTVDHIMHPMPSATRQPAVEKQVIAEQNARGQRQAEAKKNELKTLAAAKRAAAERAIEEANLASIASDPKLRKLKSNIDLRKSSIAQLRAEAAVLSQRALDAGEIEKSATDETLKANASKERDALAGEAGQKVAKADALDAEVVKMEEALADGIENLD